MPTKAPFPEFTASAGEIDVVYSEEQALPKCVDALKVIEGRAMASRCLRWPQTHTIKFSDTKWRLRPLLRRFPDILRFHCTPARPATGLTFCESFQISESTRQAMDCSSVLIKEK
jgi:hypothetical protein